jgi:hypothetical protein
MAIMIFHQVEIYSLSLMSSLKVLSNHAKTYKILFLSAFDKVVAATGRNVLISVSSA